MAQARITINEDIKRALKMLKKHKYPFLSDAEIFKMGLSRVFIDEFGGGKHISYSDKRYINDVKSRIKTIKKNDAK